MLIPPQKDKEMTGRFDDGSLNGYEKGCADGTLDGYEDGLKNIVSNDDYFE